MHARKVRGQLPVVDKRAIIDLILKGLEAELDGYARAAHTEAMDEQNKAENKYDTRGLEASYLAMGQSRQAAEAMEAIQKYKALPVVAFKSSDAIDVGAVVELDAGDSSIYFIGPCGGGMEIVHRGKAVLVITPRSPLGQLLIGRKTGDRLEFGPGAAKVRYRVVAVK